MYISKWYYRSGGAPSWNDKDRFLPWVVGGAGGGLVECTPGKNHRLAPRRPRGDRTAKKKGQERWCSRHKATLNKATTQP